MAFGPKAVLSILYCCYFFKSFKASSWKVLGLPSYKVTWRSLAKVLLY